MRSGWPAYSVVGTAKAASYGVPPLVAVVMGVLSATFGGIVRDVLAQEPSVLLRREIYLTAAALRRDGHRVLALLLVEEGCRRCWHGAAFLLRAGALRFGWTLPGFHHRPDQARRGALLRRLVLAVHLDGVAVQPVEQSGQGRSLRA